MVNYPPHQCLQPISVTFGTQFHELFKKFNFDEESYKTSMTKALNGFP